MVSKLEEVAKLEPCSIYYAEKAPGVADDIAHVVARTTGAHRKYYYRRNEYGSWTPWEQIKLDIEDNPVLPVVWKDRLLLFWLRILKTTPIDPEAVQTNPDLDKTTLANLHLNEIKNDAKANALNNSRPVRVQAVLSWSEYYSGKWQPTKTSDVNRPLNLGSFPPIGPDAFDRSDRSQLRLFNIEEEGEMLRVYIYHIIDQKDVYSSFRLYNTHSLPIPMADEIIRPNTFPTGLNRFRSGDQNTLAFQYQNTHETSAPKVEIRVLQALDSQNPITIIEPGHMLQNSWVAPFFFQDSRHAFYVDTSLPTVSIQHVTGFGLAVNPVKQQLDIPPLVLKQAPNLTPISGTFVPMSTEPRPGVVGPSSIERFVSEGVTVRISTSAAVHYDGCEISPGGGLLDGPIS